MPLTPPRDAARPRRRSLLAGAVCAAGAAGLTGACSDDGEAAESGNREDSAGARRLRQAAARDSEALLARYDGTAAAHPDLAGRLKPLRGEVVRHLEELAGSARPDRTTRGRGGGAKNRDGVPADRKEALAALAAAERRTADARTKALAGAPPELARLLASVAASGAAHAYLLTGEGS
ncbi:hypothetical protein DVA86_27570 [Streptomyces armeniacus]|uniref:Lipoprotein n=1 Tax=Streptomyces armeniacus TaxID=83291 RepID=A0A345XW14_9ACTN|nr:hypothetical protein [Streptomyces armeniacus]AXK35830.1 hypothetical protein DVA86_27570 [Streptomyces armeniacus]